MQRYFIFISVNLVSFELCWASGTVSLKLSHYKNPSGKGDNGNCCELKIPTFCGTANPCDHFFVVCLDEPHGSTTDMDQCRIGKYTTGVTSNKNEITFGNSIGGTPNPKELHFSSLPVRVVHPYYRDVIQLKVQVWDSDDNTHDFVEFLSTEVRMNASQSRTVKDWQDFQIQQRTQLDFKMAVFCDENWYGPKCDVYCKPYKGHYNCTSDGHKQCFSGLTGDNCTVDIDECQSGPCAGPGGQCVNGNDGYTCKCDPGYTGLTCETPTDQSGCQNGSCPNNASSVAMADSAQKRARYRSVAIILPLLVLAVAAVALLVIWRMYQNRKTKAEIQQNQENTVVYDQALPYILNDVNQQVPTTNEDIYSEVSSKNTKNDCGNNAYLYDNPGYETRHADNLAEGNSDVYSTVTHNGNADSDPNEMEIMENEIYN